MKSPLSGDPTIKILPIFILLSSLYVTGQTAHASICLFLGPIGDVAPVVVVFDNQMAGYSAHGFTATHDDANMTLGAAVFNGAVGGFDVAVSTAVSKPVLQGNAIDLNTVVVGKGSIQIGMADYDFASNGHGFHSQLGGTTQGQVKLGTFIDPNNTKIIADENVDLLFNSGWLDQSPFSAAHQTANDAPAGFTNGLFGMLVAVNVEHEQMEITSFNANLAQTPEPTTALIWSMLAGLGMTIRRRR